MTVYPSTDEPVTSAASPVTCSIVHPIPVPTHGAKGLFTVLSKTRVEATPLQVLNLIRDTSTWLEWNSFCPRCEINNKSTKANSEIDPDIPTGQEGWLDAGTTATIDVHMSGDGLTPGKKRTRTQSVFVTYIDALPLSSSTEKSDAINQENKRGYRICWKATGLGSFLYSERVFELLECRLDEAGGITGTDFTCYETFGGVLAITVKLTYGSTLVERFGDYSRDVREYFSKGRTSDGSGPR